MATNVVRADKVLLKYSGTAIGAQRGATLTINSDTIETTAKEDAWATFVTGKRNWTIDCDALVVLTDAGRTALETAAKDGTTIDVVLELTDDAETPNTTTYTGTAIVTSYQITASMGDVATYSVSLQGIGELTIA
ncbi:MAG: hypothetical protein J7K29_06925 [Candidatus Cloacimonetes bacterium]|nr:hypothetical protein [Candidatus Cloacimonadota bacterium]